MQRLFETNTSQATNALPDSVDAPYIIYKQFKLDDNFRTYFEGTLYLSMCLEQKSNLHRIKNLPDSLQVLNPGE